MKSKSETKRVGIGLADALTLLFIGLRLGGAIQWSWLWVLSPLWITYALLGLLTILLVLVSG